MKRVDITHFLSSEMDSQFSSIIWLNIEDKPFDRGGFGEVYHCSLINNNLVAPQVVKILVDDGTGSAKRGYDTIVRFQKEIIEHNRYLKQRNEPGIVNIPAFRALPQFSFEGVLEGKKVRGYSATLLEKGDWLLFSEVFNHEDKQQRKELRNKFYNLPLDHRLKMAHNLAEGFAHLAQMKFIYADLNPRNFFVNLRDGTLALIDFEGGAVNENPETYGKPGEWLAPEIQSQLLNTNSRIIKVDLNTDTWAVAIGIHFMLFQFHPLFFLKIRGEREMKEYFKSFQWPIIDKSHINFRRELDGTYDWYIDKLNNHIPKELFKAFGETINRGYDNPNLRLSYKQWMVAINGLMTPPSILMFTAVNPVIVNGMPVILRWQVDEKTHTIKLNNGIGDVTGQNELTVRPEKSISYTLTAIGHFGVAEETLEITAFPTPIITSLQIPTPVFSHQASISNMRIATPHLDNLTKFNAKLFSLPPNEFVKLDSLAQTFHTSHINSINRISEVFEEINKKVKENLTNVQ